MRVVDTGFLRFLFWLDTGCSVRNCMLQVFGSKVRVDAVSKVAELELAEKEKMRDKVNKIIKHGCNVFINR